MSAEAAFSPPFPFAVTIDWALKRLIMALTGMKEANCLMLLFADDITALSDSNLGLQGLVSVISEVTGGLGLSNSDRKTKKMSGNHQTPNDFTYLGSSINNQGTIDNEISHRKGKACAAFN